MSQTVFFHEDAGEEVDVAFEWYRMRSERAARRFLSELDKAVERIRQSPQQFPQIAVTARRVLLDRFPFAVVFRQTQEGIQILAVAHVKRRPNYWRNRGS